MIGAWGRRRASSLAPNPACTLPAWVKTRTAAAAAAALQIQAANPLSRALFNAAYRSKQAAFERGDLSGGRMAPFWDRLVFSKVKERVGGE